VIDSFVIGLVGAPFGLKGFVKIQYFSGEIEHLKGLSEFTLRQGDNEKVLAAEAVEVQSDPSRTILIKFAGIDSPEEAKILTGAKLIADRAHAAPLRPGEFYVEDLKGLELTAADNGEVLGRITDVVEGGGGELAEVRLNSGESRMVPFRKEFFGEINLETGKAALLERWILE
jgi:16S rRNA processing protein RimM